MTVSLHEHEHRPNRFAVIPTATRLNASSAYTGRGIRIAFIDSGFFPHDDLVKPVNRLIAYEDITGEVPSLENLDHTYEWQWHGTQTSVVAAGNGYLSDGRYRGIASGAALVLVKVSEAGRITEKNIARGIQWVIDNRKRLDIRILNISLGGDQDIPCSTSEIDQAAEDAVRQGIVVIVAAGNSGQEGRHSIPPANAPSVITVGGYSDNNELESKRFDLYHSNYGFTVDGTMKPEVLAPAMWVAAPILPGTDSHYEAESLALFVTAPDFELPKLSRQFAGKLGLPGSIARSDAQTIRVQIDQLLNANKIIATHYQHVDGTSFAAPIVSSVVAQMLEANPRLSPSTVKNILISTAERISAASVLRQGYGVVNAALAVQVAVRERHDLGALATPTRQRRGSVLTFTYHDDRAQSVSLAGDFNSWDVAATPLTKSATGLWTATIALPTAGRYAYKFFINGSSWIEDPNNTLKVSDNFGGLNSLFIVK